MFLLHGDYNPDMTGLRKASGLCVGSSMSREHTELLDALCSCVSLALELDSILLSLNFKRICRVISYFIEWLFQQ